MKRIIVCTLTAVFIILVSACGISRQDSSIPSPNAVQSGQPENVPDSRTSDEDVVTEGKS